MGVTRSNRVAAVDQDARIARQRRRVARDRRDRCRPARRASDAACAAAPARGGSNTTASKRSSSFADSGSRKRSRTLASIGFKPGVRLAAFSSAAIAWRSPSTASTVALVASGNVKVPSPQKRSAMRLRRISGRGGDEAHHLGLGGGRGLQEGARRQHHVGRTEAHGRDRALVERIAGERHARELGRGGRVRHALAHLGPQLAGKILDRHIEPVGGERHGEAHRQAPRGQAARRDASGPAARARSRTPSPGTPADRRCRAPWPRRSPRRRRGRCAAPTASPGGARLGRRSPRAQRAPRCRARQRPRSTSSRFQARYAVRSRCCSAQPPQCVKWRQSGATRSGLAESTATRRARSPRASASTCSPGSA